MNRAILTLAAMLVATGGALANSDHFDPNNASQPRAAVDTSVTGSTAKTEMPHQRLKTAAKTAADEPGQGIWGH